MSKIQLLLMRHFVLLILLLSYSKAFHHPSIKYHGPSHRLKSLYFPQTQINDRKSTTICQMEPSTIVIGGAVITASSALLYLSGSEDRERQKQYSEWGKAYVEPRDYWTEEEIKPYDGTLDDHGPILMAVNGTVYNVWKGRHFYGPGCEYHIFAGRDATRLLAKWQLEEETEEERSEGLSDEDIRTLEQWINRFEFKYDIVGKLDGFDPSTITTRTN